MGVPRRKYENMLCELEIYDNSEMICEKRKCDDARKHVNSCVLTTAFL